MMVPVGDVILAVALAAAGLSAWKVVADSRGRQDDARVDEVWSAAAREVGGVLRESSSPAICRRTPSGVELLAETFSEYDPSKQRAVTYTRVRTSALAGMRGARFRVWPHGSLGKVQRHLGLAPGTTGDAGFDEAFSATGSPRSVCVAYLDATTRRFLLDAKEGFVFQDETLRVVREGTPSKASTLVEMFHFAAQLQERWTELVSGPVRLAEALALDVSTVVDIGVTSGTNVVFARGLRRGREVTLALFVSDARLLTIVTCADTGAGDWAFERDDTGALAPCGTSATCPEAILAIVRDSLAELSELRHIDGGIELVFEGLSLDARRVAAVVDAVVEATATGGAYR